MNRRIHATQGRALRSSCSAAREKGSHFGLVLGNDADTDFLTRLSKEINVTLESTPSIQRGDCVRSRSERSNMLSNEAKTKSSRKEGILLHGT